MGFIHDDHGRSRIAVEQRRESFYIHPAYGFDVDCPTCNGGTIMGAADCIECGGSTKVVLGGDTGWAKRWATDGHPEFLLEDVPDLIRALADLPTCPPEVKVALNGAP